MSHLWYCGESGFCQVVNQAFELLLLLGGKSQLELHMLQRKVTGNRTSIVARDGFGASVTQEWDQIPFINALRNKAPRSGYCPSVSFRMEN